MNGGKGRCPNCHGDHLMSNCPKPIIDRSKRTCYICEKEGHVSANCPNKNHLGGPGHLKSVNEHDSVNKIPFFPNYNIQDQETDLFGYTKVTRGTTSRPIPTQTNVGMYLSNAFQALSCTDSENDTSKSSQFP